MQHFPHPDEYYFAKYAAAALSGLTACMGDPTNLSGEQLMENLPEMSAMFAEKMVELHRKRFPLPEQDLTENRPDWGPRFGKFPERVFDERSVPGVPGGRFITDPVERISRLWPHLPPDFFQQPEKMRGTLQDFQMLLATFGVEDVPQWVAAVANETQYLSAAKKQAVYDHLSLMLQGQKINLKSGSIKGAFDWKEAPGGYEFWEDISQSIPPVPDDVPAKILPECEGNCGMNYCDENGCIERKRQYVDGAGPSERVDVVANEPPAE